METLSAILGIVLIDLVLSGDNAIVIGMAAHRLPARQRRWAVLIGGGSAIALRIALTAIAAMLLTIPGLQAFGGLLLLWIAFKLLKQEGESSEGVKEASSLRDAVVTILVADFVMSLDNVLGVAGASGGDMTLLIFGLALSVTILMLGGSLVSQMMDRMWWLAYVGSAVIAWTGVDMFLEDPVVHSLGVIPEEEELQLLLTVAATLTVLTITHFTHRRHRANGAS
ncbi:MAG TPA: TerC family protein [Chloroflexota bacterium]|nr:TerC family protein [Chloroflexota bacterium]